MKPIFWHRDNSSIRAPLSLDYTIGPYSWSVFGGPEAAEIYATGPEIELWQLLNYTRCPVQIFSDKGDPVWWGYVSEVQLQTGKWNVGINVDTMANRVGIVYGDDSTGASQQTDWAQDDTSAGIFGIKEMLFTTNVANLTQALAARDKYLNERKYPTPVINLGDQAEATATIYCRGWMDLLAWTYYSCAYGKEVYDDDGPGVQVFGDVAARQKIAQSFRIDTDLYVSSVAIRLKKIASPADNVILEICANNAGAPGTVLTSSTVAGSTLGDYTAWVSFYFTGSSQILLNANTDYWLVIRRSGSLDGTNYYEANVNDNCGYPDGVFRIYNGSSWGARNPDTDLLFRVMLAKDTATQIQDILTACGGFLTGSEINLTSGILASPYRDGKGNGLYEVTQLLELGTSNVRRMLCNVTIDQRLQVYEEPAYSIPTYYILKDGSLRDQYNTELRKELCPVGIWARFKDVIPDSVDTTSMINPSLVFIDKTQYDPRADQLTITPRGFIDPFQIGRPRDG